MTIELHPVGMILVGLVGALASVFFYKLCTGGIRLDGILGSTGDGAIEADRLQLFLISAVGAVTYGFDALASISSENSIIALPEIPDWTLVAFGGSQGLYLVGKVLRNSGLNMKVQLGTAPTTEERNHGRVERS